MSNNHVTQRMALLAALLLATFLIVAQGKPNSFYCNPLLINGKPLDYTLFSIHTKGVLALVTGNPETGDAPKIPFRIYLRRGNLPVNSGGSIPDRSVYEIEVSEVLATARPGDFLVIEPVRKEDSQATRIIKLTDYFQTINWLFPTRKSDGC